MLASAVFYLVVAFLDLGSLVPSVVFYWLCFAWLLGCLLSCPAIPCIRPTSNNVTFGEYFSFFCVRNTVREICEDDVVGNIPGTCECMWGR